MKYVIAILMCLLVAGCNEEVCQPTAWLMAGPDADSPDNPIAGRIGIRNMDGVEFGAESVWYGDGVQGYGAYALQEFKVVDNLVPLGTTEYIGGHAAILDSDETGNTYGFIAGTTRPIRGNIKAVIEYQYNEYQDGLKEQIGSDDAHKVYAGLKVGF